MPSFSKECFGDYILAVAQSARGCYHERHGSSKRWEMLSGIPSSLRFRRYQLTLQASIDDSGRGQKPVFVLAGYVAKSDDWGAFSDEWEIALHERPRIEYFKMREAWNGTGQF